LNLVEYLQDDYYEYDMGQIEEEDRPFMIVDNDSGKIFDTRIDRHVERANKNDSMAGSQYATPTKSKSVYSSGSKDKSLKKNDLRKSMRAATWGDWWDDKKKVNHNFLRAAEAGNLADFNKFLDNDIMQGKGAEVNFKGLHDWTALHYAAENERLEIIHELLKQPNLDLDPDSTIKRTPLHLASMRGCTKIVAALVEKGANANCRDFD